MGCHGGCGQRRRQEALGLRKGIEVGKVSGDSESPCFVLAEMSHGPHGRVVCHVEGDTKSV